MRLIAISGYGRDVYLELDVLCIEVAPTGIGSASQVRRLIVQ